MKHEYLVSFVLLALYNNCMLDVTCPMAVWSEHAWSLAGLIAAGASSGQAASVTIYTNCWVAREHVALQPGGSKLVLRVIRDVPKELQNVVLFVPPIPRLERHLAMTVQKWIAVGHNDSEFVVLSDLDVLLLPIPNDQLSSVAADWLDAFAHMRANGIRLLSGEANNSPLNAGFLVLRPTREIYLEGLDLLSRANTSFNSTHGWDLRGRPRDVLPSTDELWRRTNGAGASMLRNNVWTFVGVPIDQGIFFYIFRVAHACGADLPLRLPRTRAALRRPVWRMIHLFNKPFRGIPQPAIECRFRKWRNYHFMVKQMAYLRDGLAKLHSFHTAPAAVVEACIHVWSPQLRCLHQALNITEKPFGYNANARDDERATAPSVSPNNLGRVYSGGTPLWKLKSK